MEDAILLSTSLRQGGMKLKEPVFLSYIKYTLFEYKGI